MGYLTKAKVMHPDISGREGEDLFRRMKEDYEELVKLIESGDASRPEGRPRAGFHQRSGHGAGHGWQYDSKSQSYQRPGGAQQGSYATPGEEFTPAQRLRNFAILGGGVFMGLVYYMSKSSTPNYSSSQYAVKDSSPKLAPMVPKSSGTNGNEVSNYYKKRTTKGSVKVNADDVYVSSTAPAKSRHQEEGFGTSFQQYASVARGISPGDANPAMHGPSPKPQA